MKKILALVMALVMVLGVASAMAASSKQTPGGGGTDVDNPETIDIVYTEDTEETAAIIEKFADAADAGDVLAALPDAVKANIPEGYNKINEMITAQVSGDINDVASYTVMNFGFESTYEAGKTVYVLAGILPATADGEVEWEVFTGSVKDNGSIDVTLPKAFFEKVQNKPYVLAVVSEK